MPTVEINLKDLEALMGRKLPKDLDETFMLVKGEIDKREGDNLWLDVKETNRPDLWSSEGIARELKARLGMEKGLPKYSSKQSKVEVFVEASVEKVRPFIAAAIVRDVKVTENLLVQMIQLQEKVANTFGRKRKEAAIGLYDFDKMTPPVYYKAFKDKEIEFTPLEYRVKMRPSEILQEHPKGKEYAFLLEKTDVYPFVIDAKGMVASMPPIINSQETGKLTDKTRNVFVEVTGFKEKVVNSALNVMLMALADRGGKIEAVKVHFPKGKGYPKKPVWNPVFGEGRMKLDLDYARKMTGLQLKDKEIVSLLEKARMKIKLKGKKAEVTYPDYRQDIIHPIDLVEDILVGYGYNNIAPEAVRLAVKGEEREEAKALRKAREACVGLGLQEVLQFTLSSRELQEANMMIEGTDFVELSNPVTSNRSVFRKSLIPEILYFFSRNKDALYPQKVFEAGKVFSLDEKMENKVKERNVVCVGISKPETNFTEIKSHLDAFCKAMGWKYGVKGIKHPSFIEGRAAMVEAEGRTGFVGEIHPQVLLNFGLETPVIVFEIDL